MSENTLSEYIWQGGAIREIKNSLAHWVTSRSQWGTSNGSIKRYSSDQWVTVRPWNKNFGSWIINKTQSDWVNTVQIWSILWQVAFAVSCVVGWTGILDLTCRVMLDPFPVISTTRIEANQLPGELKKINIWQESIIIWGKKYSVYWKYSTRYKVWSAKIEVPLEFIRSSISNTRFTQHYSEVVIQEATHSKEATWWLVWWSLWLLTQRVVQVGRWSTPMWVFTGIGWAVWGAIIWSMFDDGEKTQQVPSSATWYWDVNYISEKDPISWLAYSGKWEYSQWFDRWPYWDELNKWLLTSPQHYPDKNIHFIAYSHNGDALYSESRSFIFGSSPTK